MTTTTTTAGSPRSASAPSAAPGSGRVFWHPTKLADIHEKHGQKEAAEKAAELRKQGKDHEAAMAEIEADKAEIMDIMNNLDGNMCAGSSRRSCEECCLDKLNAGGLSSATFWDLDAGVHRRLEWPTNGRCRLRRK